MKRWSSTSRRATSKLDEDSQRRLKTNPLRVLDTKNPDTQAVLVDAPKLADYLDDESRAHFEGLKARLDAAGIPYVLNPKLVRGLDYYSKTVFEWVTDKLGAQGTVCAGGRYDGLVEQMGGKPTIGRGLRHGHRASGADCWKPWSRFPEEIARQVDVYVCAFGEAAELAALTLSERLRDRLPNLRLQVNAGAGSFKSQFKKADKSGALYALILGDDELAQQGWASNPCVARASNKTLPGMRSPTHLATCVVAGLKLIKADLANRSIGVSSTEDERAGCRKGLVAAQRQASGHRRPAGAGCGVRLAGWQRYQSNQAQGASALYQQLLETTLTPTASLMQRRVAGSGRQAEQRIRRHCLRPVRQPVRGQGGCGQRQAR